MITTFTGTNGVRGSHTINKSNTSQNDSFQQVFSNTSGFDISKMNTAHLATGSSLLDNNPLVLPTFENMQNMTLQLEEKLSNLLAGAGISSDPSFDIDFNNKINSVEIKSDRTDTSKISNMLNTNSEIKGMIQTVCAIGSHVTQISESLNFQKEYLASNNPQSVVSKYSHLFNNSSEPHSFSLRYNQGGLKLLYDNEEWDIPSSN